MTFGNVWGKLAHETHSFNDLSGVFWRDLVIRAEAGVVASP